MCAPGQMMLLPMCVDDFVADDTPVRIVSEIIDSLDLSALAEPVRGRWRSGVRPP